MSRENKNFVLMALIIVCVIGVIISFTLLATGSVVAQDTFPAWEYAALAYDGDTAFAFTADLAANNEINKLYDAMNPDTMTSITVMNVLGARGWEYIDYQPGETVVYMFRRPLE